MGSRGGDLSRMVRVPAASVLGFVARWRNHRSAKVAAIALAVTLAVAAWGYAWAAKNVTVVVDGVEQTCFSLRLTVGGVLADAGIKLNERDQVAPAAGDRIGEGETIVVRRAFAVMIAADGQQRESLTAQPTVREAVLEAGIELGPDDRTEPPLDEPPRPGDAIRVVRVVREFETALWRIPRKVTKVDDDSMALGLKRVIVPGKDGVEEVTFCTTYEDGVKTARKISERVVTEEPVAETVAVGTTGTISRNGETIRFRKALSVSATAYCPCAKCNGKYANGLTYTGMKAGRGVIAVDPRVIPLGSRLYVDGYGYGVAGDVGSAIKGNEVDLCYETHSEALAWGRRKVTVYIL